MPNLAENKRTVWVTTVDNPYDPFTQWTLWYKFDEKSGYQTCETLAKLAELSSNLFDVEREEAIDFAIARLLDFYEPNNFYQLAIEGKTRKFGLYSE